MYKIRYRKSKVIAAILFLAIIPLAACAADKYHSQQTTTEIPDTGLIVKFSLSEGVIIKDANGNDLRECRAPCEIASKEYGKNCPEVNRELPVCRGLTDVSVTDVHAITIIESAKNPYCYTRKVGNSYQEVCYPN